MGRGKRALGALALLVLLGAAAFVVYESFKVREIVVEGCESLSEEAVAERSGIEYGQSVFWLDKQSAMDALTSEPFIKPISIETEYPDKIVITIKERRRAACIEKENAYLIIDNECWLLEVCAPKEDIVYPLVCGLPADMAFVGQRIGTNDTFKLEVLSRVLIAIENLTTLPQSVDVSLAADIMLTTKGGLLIELGDDTELDEKIKRANAIIDELDLAESGGILNIVSVKNAYYREN